MSLATMVRGPVSGESRTSSHSLLPLARFERVRLLDEKLGDPFDARAPIHHATLLAWDEADHFPREALSMLEAEGVSREFVPVALGGNLQAYDELLYVARTIANRSMAVAVSLSAKVWSTIVWIAGSDELKARHAESILEGRTPCLAYSEEAHGADLLASDTIAERTAHGYRLTGAKWPINRASTGESVVLMARTGEKHDPRGLSLFWFEKRDLEAAHFRHLDRVPLLGVRGCDISGIEFRGANVPAHSRIGAEGEGLEIALKGLHVTRTLCAGLSLGAVDSAIRTTVRLARSRELYGGDLLRLPAVRRTLADAYALLLALDAASLAMVRMLHVSPGQCATTSAVAKYAIPHLAEAMLGRLATVHGARFFMRAHHDFGVMQRTFRDNLLISIFDGSAPVNLHSLATQLPRLARFALTLDGARAHAAWKRARTACTVVAPPPALDGSALELTSRGDDDLLNALPAVASEIAHACAGHPLGPALLSRLDRLQAALRTLYEDIEACTARARGPVRSSPSGAALSDAAAKYACLHVAAAAVHVWWRHQGEGSATVEPWLVLALSQLVQDEAESGLASETELENWRAPVIEELLQRSDATPGGYSYLFRGQSARAPGSAVSSVPPATP